VQSIRNAFVKTVMAIVAISVMSGYRATILASYIQTFSSARGVHSTALATP
jgi:hypothetical protein